LDIKREPPKKRARYLLIAGGVVVIVGLTFALSNLESRPPSVDRATLIIDSVAHGTLIVNIRAPGTLVPEDIRYVAAVTAGRVEGKPVAVGATVNRNTVILELSNPDVQLQMLNAQSDVTRAESDLITLRNNLETQRLSQAAVVAQMKTANANARRALRTFEALDSAKKGLASEQELAQARDVLTETKERLDVEEQRLKVMSGAIQEQIRLANASLERLRTIAKFQSDRVESMKVLAGQDGQLLSLALELGQWVNPGQELARVAQPGRLKAVLRVPESQAPDVALGQPVSIDTRNGLVEGHVTRSDPTSIGGTVTVEVKLDGALPKGARTDLSVDGVIETERLSNTLYVGRPAYGQPESTVGLFKLDPDGKNATRVNVKLGRTSVTTIQVIAGLKKGDRIITSDMSAHDNVPRVRIE
jgi:HlyD family secretion protein